MSSNCITVYKSHLFLYIVGYTIIIIIIIINFITDSLVQIKTNKQDSTHNIIQYNKNKYNFSGDNYTNASMDLRIQC